MIRMMSVFKAPAAATPHSFVVGYVFVFGGSCRSDLFFSFYSSERLTNAT